MQHVLDKAKPIRLLILDVDGILTNGMLYYGPAGQEIKGFNILDGLGIKLLQKSGVKVAVISGKTSDAVKKRLEELGITSAYLGQENKIPAYQDLLQKYNIEDKEIAYMGDDLPDLPLLRRVGFAMTVPDAPEIVKQHVDFITNKKGGRGAVREACEFIMEAQGQYQSMIQSYLD